MEQQINEQQLITMAQNEERALMQKQELLEQLISIIKEATESSESLKEIQKSKNPTVLVKLGIGIMVEAKITDTTTCKRSFSENGYKNEKIEDTLQWIEQRKINLEKQATRVQEEVQKSQAQLSQIVSILKQIDQARRTPLQMQKNVIDKTQEK